MADRQKGGSWYSTPAAKRRRKLRGFTLSEDLHRQLDGLEGVNLSELAESALRAHPRIGLPPEGEADHWGAFVAELLPTLRALQAGEPVQPADALEALRRAAALLPPAEGE